MARNADLTDMGYVAIRVYTLAMRFPRMIGKGFNGERLPGGPYTLHQFVGGGLIFGLAGISAYYIPIINPLVNLLVGAGLTLVIGSALAHVPIDGIRLRTRLLWILGLCISTAPTASEPMPTSSPLALIGGEVLLLEPPPRQRRLQPAPGAGRRDPSRLQRSAVPAFFAAADHADTAPRTPRTQTSHSAAAVFGALTRTA